jgi:2-polyprenyl-3-methyl-5-hydroxy-6-metoxy-1,4-benzoquinol methylase
MFQRTQLDSHTGCSVSRTRLTRCLGGDLSVVKGKTVLEVGCGAGRFTELLLSAGARVCACDISVAIEANRANCMRFREYLPVQADVRALPFARDTFDMVICLGVIQHTPNPERTIWHLSNHVRRGGTLVIDHYGQPSRGGVLKNFLRPFMPRSILRQLLLMMSPTASLRATNIITRMILPIHTILWRKGLVFEKLRRALCQFSPVADRYGKHPEMAREYLEEWAYLDTHDGLTDRFKHFRTSSQIHACLSSCGLTEIHTVYAGNGVEALAIKPKQ